MGVMRPRGITGFSLLNSFVLGCRVDFPLTVLSTQLVWKVCVCVCVCVCVVYEWACMHVLGNSKSWSLGIQYLFISISWITAKSYNLSETNRRSCRVNWVPSLKTCKLASWDFFFSVRFTGNCWKVKRHVLAPVDQTFQGWIHFLIQVICSHLESSALQPPKSHPLGCLLRKRRRKRRRRLLR